MKKNAGAKIFAILALFGIIIGIVGTGALFLLEGGTSNYGTQQIELTPEEINELIEQQQALQSGALDDNSAIEVTAVTGSGEEVEVISQ